MSSFKYVSIALKRENEDTVHVFHGSAVPSGIVRKLLGGRIVAAISSVRFIRISERQLKS